ncbi:Protein transport protein Sec24B [Balamuthia mandrillaris]
MALRLSLQHFPESTGMKQASGLPWGVVVQPFISPEEGLLKETNVKVSKIARCQQCFAYINPYATFGLNGWQCCLCDNVNKPSRRYSTPQKRRVLPELKYNFVEFQVPDEAEQEGELALPPQAVFIALVDVSGTPESLELVKSGLLGALKALPPSCLFGLVTFSGRVSVYDLASPVPHVKHVGVRSEGSCSIGLEEVLPLCNFLVELSSNEANVAAAIDSLRVLNGSTLVGNENAQRGFGPAIKSTIDFLELFGSSIKNVRLLTFLCGWPNYGIGALDDDNESVDSLKPQHRFYLEQAERAAEAGTCIDLFVVTSKYVGLASLKDLTVLTGGNLMVYDTVESATLPQDIYRQFSRPQASHAMLRLRTSEEFRTCRAFGHFYPDTNFDNLYRIAGCDQHKCFAFDFEFLESNSLYGNERPAVQMAFAYTYIPSVHDPNREVKRRVRIYTIQLEVARSLKKLYKSAIPENILSILTHKLIKASIEDGVEEARLLLRDWLITTVARYLENFTKQQRNRSKRGPSPIDNLEEGDIPEDGDMTSYLQLSDPQKLDYCLSRSSLLQNLVRSSFALLKNGLLKAESLDSDTRTYLQCLYSGLEPRSLYKALYPDLSSFISPNDLAQQQLPLRRTSFASSSPQLFLLDAFTLLCAYYRPSTTEADGVTKQKEGENESEEEPEAEKRRNKKESRLWPLPKDSTLRQKINQLKGERLITPQVVMVKAGAPEEHDLLNKFLLEEKSEEGPAIEEFLQGVLYDVLEIQKELATNKK